ncbi:MAG: hypothetical protein RDV48_04695 [Candidatus Eremiobacteraeota bacterium]|nr:hypothetical protein [Candidatus Eremiobacteraeota bacterium]
MTGGKRFLEAQRFFIMAVLVMLIGSGSAVTAKEYGSSNPLREVLKSFSLGEPMKKGNIALYPVIRQQPSRMDETLVTLDEAMEKGWLAVTELKPEDVNKIMVKNDSSRWVFIMAGEILTGSKQDRILKDDVLIPPRSGRIMVNAFCVEADRWTYKSDKFSSNRTASNIAVRQEARASQAQSGVWEAVAKTQSSLGYSSGTKALNETYRAPAVEKGIDDLYSALYGLPGKEPRAVGVVVAIGDEVLCADLFGSHELLRSLWPKLLKSYLLEAVSRSSESADVARHEAQSLLDKAASSEASPSDPPGEGKLYTFEGSAVSGAVLTYRDKLIHSDIFPKTSRKKIDHVRPIQRNY